MQAREAGEFMGMPASRRQGILMLINASPENGFFHERGTAPILLRRHQPLVAPHTRRRKTRSCGVENIGSRWDRHQKRQKQDVRKWTASASPPRLQPGRSSRLRGRSKATMRAGAPRTLPAVVPGRRDGRLQASRLKPESARSSGSLSRRREHYQGFPNRITLGMTHVLPLRGGAAMENRKALRRAGKALQYRG